MNDEKSKVQIYVTNFVIAENFQDGSFQEQGEGEEFTAAFWDGVPVDTFYHQHIRVPELRGKLEYQYKLHLGKMNIRTLHYHLTSRPEDKFWYRANIDFRLDSISSTRVNSPDSMWQDAQWHDYIVQTRVDHGSTYGSYFNVRIEYDGSNNGVGENDSWGRRVLLAPR